MPTDPADPMPPVQQGATRGNNQKTRDPAPDPYHRPENELSPKQRTAIELLLQGYTDAQVAAHLGVDRTTVYRWRTRHHDFIDELEQQRRILWQQSTQRLQAMFQPALDILQKQLTGDDPRLALRAAALLLRVATPARLARLTQGQQSPPARRSSPAPAVRPSAHDAFADLLEAYINAPLPGEAGRLCEENAAKLPEWDEDDDEGRR